MIRPDNSHFTLQADSRVAVLGWQAHAVSLKPLVWLNFVCLDAPLVAISWQWLFAHNFHLVVPLGHRIALFFTAWLIYLADRFGDSISLRTSQPKSLRQQFCSRHRNTWLEAIICVAIVDAIVIWKAVDYGTLVPGAILGALTIVYVAINHSHSEVWEIIPVKEFAVGCLFAAGTLLGVTPHIFAESWTMILAAILFAAVCWLNCVSIAIWERDLDRIQGRHSIATHWPRMNLPVGDVLPILLGGCALLVAFDLLLWPVACCLGASGLLLSALCFAPVSRDERTALADLVLLTPLVLLFVERFL